MCDKARRRFQFYPYDKDIRYLIEQIRGDIEELEKKKKRNDVMNCDWSDLILLASSDDTFSSWADVGDDLQGDVEASAFTQAIEAHQRKITDAIITHSLEICANKNTEVKTKIVIGDPKEKICETVEELNADLLVMGCHSFGPIKRMFLGSVTTAPTMCRALL
nr:hypothetical protein [Tanacetum cinerariifolium]